MRKSRLCMSCIAIMTTAMLVTGCGVSNVNVGTALTEEETEVVAVEVTSEEKDLGESSTQPVTSGETPEGTTDEGTGSTQEASADITAEDLVNVLRGVEGEDVMDIHCKISIGVDDGSGAQSASVRMLADYDMVGNHLCMYLTGTTGMSVYGQTVTEDTEAYVLEKNEHVVSYAKNDHLGFKVLYTTSEGVIRNYFPDFLIRLDNGTTLVLETKGQKNEDVEKKQQLTAKEHLAGLASQGRDRGQEAGADQPLQEMSAAEQRQQKKAQEAAERRKKRAKEAAENEIAQLEEEIASLEKELSEPAVMTDAKRLQTLSDELSEKHRMLDEAYEKWVELQDEV